jgi:diguanylate cyclase (GGDEF)-like protein
VAVRSREGVPRGASASATLGGIRSRKNLIRPLALARKPTVPVALVALAAVAAIALTVVAIDRALRENGTERADARLAAALRASAFALDTRVRAAEAEAEALARSRAVQVALVAGDRERLARIVRRARMPVVLRSSRLAPVGRPVAGAIRRSAAVGPLGRRLGQVTTFVPLDDTLLRRIERAGDVQAGVVLAFSRGRAAGTRAGRSASVEVVGGRTPVRLVALLPERLVDPNGTHRRRIVLAAIATITTSGLLLLTVLQLVRLRRRSQRGSRDRRRSLGPRSAPPGRPGGGDALALVGDALAATHDPEALLPVILGAAIEATGATGGRLVAGSRELAIRGAPTEAGSLAVPLGNGDDAGSLVLYPPADGFTSEARELARWLATQASIALENARLHGLVKAQAVTDELTGLANRRRFMEVLELELRRSDRFRSPLALVLADLDDFKLVNDRFGHQTGDDVLRALSRVFRASLRDVDLPARLGGEEFAVLLPETDALGAEGLAERLRVELAALQLQGPAAEPLRVTASFGVAVYPEAATGDDLLTAADAALYVAKAAGKNRVILAPDTRLE